MKRRVITMPLGLAMAAVVGVTGCTSADTDAPASRDGVTSASQQPESPAEQYAALVAEAKKRGADAEQLKVLADAGTQAVTFQAYEAAVTKSVSCIRGKGIDVIGDTVTSPNGFPVIQYGMAASSSGRSDDETLKEADLCVNTHSFGIEQSYRSSPTNNAAAEGKRDAFREPMLACMKERGLSPTDAMTWDELIPMDIAHSEKQGKNASGELVLEPCVIVIGLP